MAWLSGSRRTCGDRRLPPPLSVGTAAVAERDARLAVDVHELQHVARINEVRVLDLGIDVPDFGPIPGVAQEHLGDVPQRVAGFHDVLVGGIRGQRDVAAGGDGALALLCGRADRKQTHGGGQAGDQAKNDRGTEGQIAVFMRRTSS